MRKLRIAKCADGSFLDLPVDAVTEKLAFLGRTGCHRKGQLLRMFDGSTKAVEDIVVGDELLGLDEIPRRVLELRRGYGKMAAVIPLEHGGSRFVVNLDHVLTLAGPQYQANPWPQNLADVSVRDWLQWSGDAALASRLLRLTDKPTLSKFAVRLLEDGEDYYGFTLSDDGRYLLDDFTVTHNSGKSYAATKLAELMLDVGAQVVALDVVGIWYGLRTGKKAIKIPVLGGLHGDVPLDPAAGALVADLIVDRDLSAVLDISQFLDSEKNKFARDFADRFFYRKKEAPSAVHLFLEECQELVPQNCQKGEERMLHAFERLVKLGRNFGIGVSLISQRPQEVNKKALNQVECIFAFQMTGTHERKALEYWISDKGIDIDVMALLPKLKVGSPHVWSPRWLAVSKEAHILPKRTLDTSSTPKVGMKAARDQSLTPIDMKVIRSQMASAIVKAKEDDPKELKKRIADLERGHRGIPAATAAPAATVVPEIRYVESFNEASFNSVLEQEIEDFSRVRKIVQDAEVASRRRWDNYRGEMRAVVKAAARGKKFNVVETHPDRGGLKKGVPTALQMLPEVTSSSRRATTVDYIIAGEADKLGKCELGLLGALKQHGELSLKQATIIAGYSTAASTKDVAISKLRKKELVEGGNDALQLTPAGKIRAKDIAALPEGSELAEHWFEMLGKCPQEILRYVLQSHPQKVTKQEISVGTGYPTTSSTIDVGLAKLRTLELIFGKNDGISANEKLVD